ncbi:MAG: hypothetical protein M9933_08845 [Chitinophagaceae bacterium]|nr:hypothetical protein [Chitinophagaceae bacterium]
MQKPEHSIPAGENRGVPDFRSTCCIPAGSKFYRRLPARMTQSSGPYARSDGGVSENYIYPG